MLAELDASVIGATWGELLVGAYHERVTGCEVIGYNNRSDEQGDQMEADVVGVDTDVKSGRQTVYVCEVVTHMDGDLYSGTPDANSRWAEYADNDAYVRSFKKVWRKFEDDHRYVTRAFPGADEYEFQFWAPVVTGWARGGDLIDGLNAVSDEFLAEYDHSIELVINQEYTERIETLEQKAQGDTSNYGSPAFRFLQILENLK